jgi:GxxExxY protein
MNNNQIGTIIVDAAFTVHRAIGPGLLESAYEHCLLLELVERGLEIESQLPLPLIYKERRLGCGYRVDIKVNNAVIVEIKSVEALNDIHIAQMITYLKLSNCRLGYLINFNTLKLQEGIRRIIL